MTQTQVAAVFPAHSFYRGLALIALVVAFPLLWELRQGPAWGNLLGGGLALAAALYYGRLALSRVEVSATQVRLVTPLASAHAVELRQIADVHREGRLVPALLVLYHPRRADGLFDHEALRSLSLPAVAQQDALQAALDRGGPGHTAR